jgi:hypothetical protein
MLKADQPVLLLPPQISSTNDQKMSTDHRDVSLQKPVVWSEPPAGEWNLSVSSTQSFVRFRRPFITVVVMCRRRVRLGPASAEGRHFHVKEDPTSPVHRHLHRFYLIIPETIIMQITILWDVMSCCRTEVNGVLEAPLTSIFTLRTNSFHLFTLL